MRAQIKTEAILDFYMYYDMGYLIIWLSDDKLRTKHNSERPVSKLKDQFRWYTKIHTWLRDLGE